MRFGRVDTSEIFFPRPMTAHDRCDRCGSQAYVHVALPTGVLMFCAHHYEQYEARLRPVAMSVTDERDRLHAGS
jgi:hypothetical protein